MPPHWRNRTPKANLYWIPMLVMSPSLASSTSGKAHLESNLYVQYSMVARSSPLRRPNTERLNWKYAAYHFIVKNHSYLCPRNFTMRVDNQALSWLKTIGRWIMTLEKYHFRVEHRPRTQHRNADGLSKRTNDYRWREHQLETLLPVAERWNFLSQEEYEQLPIAPWFDLQGRIIPNHPELPEHLKNLQRTPPDIVQRVIPAHNVTNDEINGRKHWKHLCRNHHPSSSCSRRLLSRLSRGLD